LGTYFAKSVYRQATLEIPYLISQLFFRVKMFLETLTDRYVIKALDAVLHAEKMMVMVDES
jgi:hypothetical protein